MSEENKALARRSWENLDLLEEVYAADLLWHGPDQDTPGMEEARQFISAYKTAFPDLSASVEEWERYDNLGLLQQLGLVSQHR